MKKEKMGITNRVLFILALALFLIMPVSANDIGGEVFTEGSILPGWQNVFVYDIDDVGNYYEISVNPSDYRYSFANSGTKDKSPLSKTSIVRAEILDFESGFMAGPVEMNLSQENNKYYSCSGCDIFPKMEFREVVQLKNPRDKLIISDTGTFDFEVNVYDDCDFYLRKNDSYENLCESGCDYYNTFFGEFGSNNINFMTDCHTGSRNKKGSSPQENFKNGEFVNFDKKMHCHNEESFFVNFYGSKSDINVPVVDFIPNEYEIFNVSGNGVVFDEDGYYAIEWKELDVSFNLSYNIKPKKKMESCQIGLTDGTILRNAFSSEFLVDSGSAFNLKVNDFYADCNFSNKIEFQMVESVSFSDTLPKKLKKGDARKINLHLDISQNVSDLELREYIPVEFDVSGISDNGRIEFSSSDYDVIIWDLDGSNFDFSYSIKSDVNGDYNFKSEIEGNDLSERSINVYTVISSSGGKGKSKNYKYVPVNFSKVGPDIPIVKKIENFTAALESKEFMERGAMDLKMFRPAYVIYSRAVKLLGSYLVENNLGENTGELSFEYKVPKGKYSDVKFYGVDNKGGLFRMSGNIVRESGDDVVYGSYSNEFFSRVLVYGDKIGRTLWDRWIDWTVDQLLKFDVLIKGFY